MKSKIRYQECSVSEFMELFPGLCIIPSDFLDDENYIVRFVPNEEGKPSFIEFGYSSDMWVVS